MTTRAPRRDPRVIKRGAGKRGRGLMARLARCRRWHVCRRLGHDPRISAAMTGCAARCDPRVIHRGARPEGRRRLVARLAPERSGNVTRRFAQRRRAVMTGGAAGRDPRVVIARGYKQPIRRANFVTAITRQSRRHMPSRLPAGLNSVMAGHAGTGCDPLMFEGRSRPTHRPMAAVTGHGRRNMSRRLACRNSLVMAFGAGSRSDTVMGKERRRPICRPMTAAAINHGRQVVRRLKGGDDSSAG